MAAFRRLLPTNRSILPSTSALFLSHRGVASKLFVGGKLNELSECSYTYSSANSSAGLSFYTTENGLSQAFSQHGQVIEAKIVMDRVSDKSKGFGFVTYASEDEAEKALQEMNGKPLNGRVIFVDYAKPKADFGGGMPIARGPPEPPTEQQVLLQPNCVMKKNTLCPAKVASLALAND
ncbi:PREDICTED: glycine-rich RNA-binding protein 4, mitochondrial-like [Nicotiana attenuata]|uniref:glycine-rich RNA-binding protein 4, mitochondrial-like n=1 Tax=Nicotiana attenuata TaxID=49451 RepID=UPI0009053251|nr:PREDICTED: glycine-rich RNA-binding protein 4, mitochondrial-like [Nicotiana attenuata]